MKKVFLILILIMVLGQGALNSWAVTYRNDGFRPIILKDKQGSQVVLMPGQELITNYYVDLTKTEYLNLTKVSDEPYAKSALASDDVNSGQTVSVNLDADFIVFKCISGSVNVFTQSASNTPAILTAWDADAGGFLLKYDGTYDTLEVTGSGTARIVQYKTSY